MTPYLHWQVVAAVRKQNADCAVDVMNPFGLSFAQRVRAAPSKGLSQHALPVVAQSHSAMCSTGIRAHIRIHIHAFIHMKACMHACMHTRIRPDECPRPFSGGRDHVQGPI